MCLPLCPSRRRHACLYSPISEIRRWAFGVERSAFSAFLRPWLLPHCFWQLQACIVSGLRSGRFFTEDNQGNEGFSLVSKQIRHLVAFACSRRRSEFPSVNSSVPATREADSFPYSADFRRLGFETRSQPMLTRSYPCRFTFYLARPMRSIHQNRVAGFPRPIRCEPHRR